MKTIYQRNTALLLLLKAVILATLVSGCSDDNDTPVVVAPEPTPEPTEPAPARLAVKPVPVNCSSNELCNYAVTVANQFSDKPDNTCYIKELSVDGQEEMQADIQLDGAIQAYVSNSGFMQHLLIQAGGASQAGYQELEQQNLDGFPWPLSFQYQSYFKSLHDGNETSGSWAGLQDISEVQAGDVLAWCVGDWCSGESALRDLDTGHVALVVDSEPVSPEQIESRTTGIPETASFYQVAVVDASDEVHSSIFSDAFTVEDRRHQSGRLKHASCHYNGGIGAGVLWLAQWQESGQTYWSVAYHNEANYDFHNANSSSELKLAIGRLN